MGNKVFGLVTFISVFLASTRMSASESGSDDNDDVIVTSSSSTFPLRLSTVIDCFAANFGVSICSTRDTGHEDEIMTSPHESNVTTTPTVSFSEYAIVTKTTSQPFDYGVTSGASCDGETPRKSESDPRFRWVFCKRHSYLNITLAESFPVIEGYFFIKNYEGEELRWNVTIVNRSQRKTISIVSRRREDLRIHGAFGYWFRLEKPVEAKEMYVAFVEGQQGEATERKQPPEQRGLPINCDSSFMADVELLPPCDDQTKAVNERTSEADAVSDVSASTFSRQSDDRSSSGNDDDRLDTGATLDHGNLGNGTSMRNPFPSTTSSVYPATDPVTTRSNRPTPPFTGFTKPTLIPPSTESWPEGDKLQKYKGSFRIRNQDFLPNLGRESTDEYKSLHSKIHPVLNASYSLTCGPFFHGIRKIGFRSGSIVVDNWFELFGNFSDQMRNRSSTILVDEFHRSGMDVDPTSFQFDSDNGKDEDDKQANDNLLLIVVVSSIFGVLFLVCVVLASLLIWRKRKQSKQEAEDDFEHQRGSLETRPSNMISGIPTLVWQNMPSLKAGFDDQSLFVYELPNPSSAKVHLPNRKLPGASASAFSSCSTASSFSPKDSLSYSRSRPSGDSKRDSKFHIPRPRTIPESTVATSFSGISPRGSGNSPHHGGNSQDHGGNSQNDGVEASQVWGQLKLDYNSITHDYFVSGPSTITARPAEERDGPRAQPNRPCSRTTKLSSRKSGSAPDAVDFGNVFLPSNPPFQLADVLRCHELPPEEVSMSDKATRRSTEDRWGADGSRRVELEEWSIDDANNNTSGGPCVKKNGQKNGLESRCSTDRCCSQSLDRTASSTQSPLTSGATRNSHMTLLATIYAKSLKKKRKRRQAPDNIHRSTTFTDEAFFQHINSGTSEL